MSQDRKKVINTLNPRKVWLPAIISVGFVVYMLLTDDNFTLEKLNLVVQGDLLFLSFAAILLVIREVAYVYRIRFLAAGKLDFTASTYIILLWEFASSVTPSVVGGTPVAVFLMMKEGLSMGKSLAYAMVTAIFDNLYLVIFSPLFYFLFRDEISDLNMTAGWEAGITAIFATSYVLIVFYTAIMSFAVFYRPRWFKWLMIKITGIRFLRRWRYAAYQQGNEVMIASKELRGKTPKYWWRISYTTFMSWTARFAMLNFMILAFVDINFTQNLISYGKHVVLWVFMLAAPTPGSSGAAEFGFARFFEMTLGDYTGIVTILWRAFSYYPFLLIGIFVLPRWINRVFFKKSTPDELSEPVVAEDPGAHSE